MQHGPLGPTHERTRSATREAAVGRARVQTTEPRSLVVPLDGVWRVHPTCTEVGVAAVIGDLRALADRVEDSLRGRVGLEVSSTGSGHLTSASVRPQFE